MSSSKKVPMTTDAQRRIQRSVDRTPNPSPQQKSFKTRTAAAVAKGNRK